MYTFVRMTWGLCVWYVYCNTHYCIESLLHALICFETDKLPNANK